MFLATALVAVPLVAFIVFLVVRLLGGGDVVRAVIAIGGLVLATWVALVLTLLPERDSAVSWTVEAGFLALLAGAELAWVLVICRRPLVPLTFALASVALVLGADLQAGVLG